MHNTYAVLSDFFNFISKSPTNWKRVNKDIDYASGSVNSLQPFLGWKNVKAL